MSWTVNNTEGGDFYKPANGTYVGKFLGIEDRGEREGMYGKYEAVSFRYELLTFPAREPVLGDDGQPAIVDPIVPKKLGKKSNARKHFAAMMPDRDFATGESGEALEQEALSNNAEVCLQYGKGDKGDDGILLQVFPVPSGV